MLFANQSMFNKHLLFGMGYENLEEEESQIQKFKKKKKWNNVPEATDVKAWR